AQRLKHARWNARSPRVRGARGWSETPKADRSHRPTRRVRSANGVELPRFKGAVPTDSPRSAEVRFLSSAGFAPRSRMVGRRYRHPAKAGIQSGGGAISEVDSRFRGMTPRRRRTLFAERGRRAARRAGSLDSRVVDRALLSHVNSAW